MSTSEAKSETSGRKTTLRQTLVPSVGLIEALRLARALRDNYALEPATPVDVGVAIGIAPTSGGFRTLAGASIAYGLTEGGYNAQQIALTDLGRRAVAPLQEGDDAVAMRQALERPTAIGEFVEKYNGSRLPTNSGVVGNVLHTMGVPFDRTEEVYRQVLADLEHLGYIKEVNGAKFLQRPSGATPLVETREREALDAGGTPDFEAADETPLEPSTPSNGNEPPRPNAIFLGHGKSKKPLEQLIRILDEYGIPHKEAEAEANAGRPIPTKVAETMRRCGAAILIFTADEQLTDTAGNEIWRPSENVIHELGAASVLYDNRIIIFREEGVSLASNYSSIGYINFEKNKLSEKGIELFRELVNFKIVNITVSS